MSIISISHTAADGTTVTGDPRPHHQILKDAGFRWSSRQQFWYLPNSRDRLPDHARIGQVFDGLREHFEVEADIEEELRPMAEREAARRERLEDRQDALDSKAERKGAEAETLHGRARDMASVIPFGQPILVGHHSEGRDRRYRDRIHRTFERAFETLGESQDAARRADASRDTLAHRESAPATIRRIERLEADLRDIDRKLAGERCQISGRKMKPEAVGKTFRCPGCFTEQTVPDDLTIAEHYTNGHDPASGEWKDRLDQRRSTIIDELDYWRAHLASLEAEGVKLYGPDDFKKGDRVLAHGHPATVIRVNKKSLSVSTDIMPTPRGRPCGYDRIRPLTEEGNAS